MTPRYTKEYLYQLRNEIDIAGVIGKVLDLPTKNDEGIFRFLCPLCSDFHTAVNPKTNLARCFRCQRNFNPIDMIMTVKECSFVEAVRFLRPFVQK